MPKQPARVEVRPLEQPEYIDVLEDSGHLTDTGLLPPCPPELIVSAHIKAEEQWMGVDSEKTKEYRELNEHFRVRNSDDHIFQIEHQDTFEQRKRVASSVSQLSNSSPQRSPSKRGQTDN